MKKKILFITPPYHCGVVEVAGRWMPLGFVYLAAAARRVGWEPIIYDAMTKNHDHTQIKARIRELAPDCVATTAITATFPDALEVLRSAKAVNPGVITLIGGVHPTFMDEEVLEYDGDVVDYVVRGEGERTLEALLRGLDAGAELKGVSGLSFQVDEKLVRTPDRTLMGSLEVSHDEWDLLDWEDYTYFVIPKSRLAVVSTARGCTFTCVFCSQQRFWNKSWRARSPEAAAEEILNLQKSKGANVFLIADEYPTQDQARWRAFLERLAHAKFDGYLLMETRAADIVRDEAFLPLYRKAGVIHVYVGLEATDQKTLDFVKKELELDESKRSLALLREHGMISETSFVLGFPWETEESLEETLRLSEEYDPDFAHYLAITPWPYADFYDEMEPHIEVFDYRKYNLIDPIIKPTGMTRMEVDRAIIECYRRFYMGKLRRLASDTDPFRRDYLLRSMRLIMNSSFLKTKMGSLGEMPGEVEKLLRNMK